MNCRAGDLAVTRFEEWVPPCWVGLLVQVVELQGEVEYSHDPGAHWWVRPIVRGAVHGVRTRHDGAFLYPDSLLQPIRGQQVRQDEQQEARA